MVVDLLLVPRKVDGQWICPLFIMIFPEMGRLGRGGINEKGMMDSRRLYEHDVSKDTFVVTRT
jgi:hypothetical protein